MLVGGQHYPKRYPKDCKNLSSWIGRILFYKNSSLPTYWMDGWGPMGEGAHRKCYLITEVAVSFVLRGEVLQKCNCLTQHVWFTGLRMCEFPEASWGIFKYCILPARQDVFQERARGHVLLLRACPRILPGWLGTKKIIYCSDFAFSPHHFSKLNFFSGPRDIFQGISKIIARAKPGAVIKISFLILICARKLEVELKLKEH